MAEKGSQSPKGDKRSQTPKSDKRSQTPSGWEGRVVFTNDGTGVAYRPGEVIVAGERIRDVRPELVSNNQLEPIFPESEPEPDSDEKPRSRSITGRVRTQFYRLRVGNADPVAESLDLQDEGIVAQPNHVVLAHNGSACSCPCPPHPAVRWAAGIAASGIAGSPLFASPLFASPLFASPLFASPLFASPLFASPEALATGRRKSSAKPSGPPQLTWKAAANASATSGTPHVAILDTGFAGGRFQPAALAAWQIDEEHWETPDKDGDYALDPAAGHGTFIAGIIEGLAPGCRITIERVLSNYGDGDEVEIARRLDALAGTVEIFNLSFGGYAAAQMHVLGAAVRRVQEAGAVVVASAGNDGTCHPTFPSALPGVIGVGAVGPNGPAPFSNYGPWVRACAPGVDIVSSFFGSFEGKESAPTGGTDPDNFAQWARWSGTSFAAPVVTAALARQMQAGASAKVAVQRVIDAPALLRIPDLGTVVNLQ